MNVITNGDKWIMMPSLMLQPSKPLFDSSSTVKDAHCMHDKVVNMCHEPTSAQICKHEYLAASMPKH